MSLKLKILGMALLAVMATSAFAVTNASGTDKGHFVADPPTDVLKIKGTEQFPGDHNLSFTRMVNGQPTGEPIKCTHAEYHGELTGALATTSTSVKVTPTYKNCATETGTWGEVKVTHPETKACETNVFDFTAGNPGTVHVNCTITVDHPSCDITVEPQTVSGVTYTKVTEEGKHAFTLNVNVPTIKTHAHGLCVFVTGTNPVFRMTGTVTVWGTSEGGARVNVTYTE